MAGNRWTEKEDNFLKCHYPCKTAEWCANQIQRSKSAIQIRAKNLGIQAIGRRGCRQIREILQVLSDNCVVCRCPKHGKVVHKLYANDIVRCKDCLQEYNKRRRGNRVWTDHTRYLAKLNMRKQRATPIGKYTNRIRSVLHQCSVGRISFSKDLPYTAIQLCDHLESIRQKQRNLCPVCERSYSEVKDSIDHITPISTATSKEEMLSLFALSNLSLLCIHCNSAKGAKLNA